MHKPHNSCTISYNVQLSDFRVLYGCYELISHNLGIFHNFLSHKIFSPQKFNINTVPAVNETLSDPSSPRLVSRW